MPELQPITLPLNLHVPLLTVVLALVLWGLLDQVARRLPAGSVGRGLLLSSRRSVAVTALVAGLGWWLAEMLDPAAFGRSRWGIELRTTLITLGAVWTLLRGRNELRRRREAYACQLLPALEAKEQQFLFDVLLKLIGISAFVVLVLQILSLLGVSAAVLITTGGFGAAAVAFGAQGIVSNSLSGLSLYINRPFVVGEFIDIPSEGLMGTVESIGWFYTQLRSLDRQPVFIPNTIFTSKSVLNISEIDNRRIWIEFGLTYDDRPRIPAILAELNQVLAGHSGVEQDKTKAVNFIGYGDSSLDLRLLCHANSGDVMAAWALQQDLLLAIGDVVERHGASMPFPTRTLIQAPGAAGRP